MRGTAKKFQILRKTSPPSVHSEPLVVSSIGTHGKIQLNRPEALNALNYDMINEIRSGFFQNFKIFFYTKLWFLRKSVKKLCIERF